MPLLPVREGAARRKKSELLAFASVDAGPAEGRSGKEACAGSGGALSMRTRDVSVPIGIAFAASFAGVRELDMLALD